MLALPECSLCLHPQGFLPYEVYEEFAKSYGEEVARLVVSFDNLFITGQEQQQQSGQPRVNMTPRTQLLKESVQLLVSVSEMSVNTMARTEYRGSL